MYYWDDRDGPEQQGWWVGSDIGGAEVRFARVSRNRARMRPARTSAGRWCGYPVGTPEHYRGFKMFGGT